MTFSKALKRLTCALSLLLAACAGFASELTDFRDAVSRANTRAELQRLLSAPPASIKDDGSLGSYFSYSLDYLEAGVGDWQTIKRYVVEELDAYILLGKAEGTGKVRDATAAAKDILESPIYVDRKQRKDRNWLDKVGDRLGDRILKWLSQFDFNAPRPGGGFLSGLMGGLTVFMWVVVLAVIGLVLFFVLRNVSGAAKRKRRVGGILEDDEPERTADQWLEQADRLTAEGRHREAVRCLYLACLVRYDDGNVARFRRHETNWEHLYRIEGSARNPQDIDFRSTTQRFDKVWYGYQATGPQDVNDFKEVYKRLCVALQIKAAA